MAISILIFILLIDVSKAFLFNSSSFELTSHEFQLLSQKILAEKQLRYTMETSIAHLQNVLDNAKTDIEHQLKVTKKELASVKSALAEQASHSENLRLSLDKEKGNMIMLEHAYTMLVMDFRNLSLSLTPIATSMPTYEEAVSQLQRMSGFMNVPLVTFNVKGAADSTPNKDQVIIFHHVINNIDQAFNSATGIFTAPVNGTYLFTVQACALAGDNKKAMFQLVVDDSSNVILTLLQHDSSFYGSTSSSVPQYLVEEQQVWVQSAQDSGPERVLYDDAFCENQFSGVLVDY